MYLLSSTSAYQSHGDSQRRPRRTRRRRPPLLLLPAADPSGGWFALRGRRFSPATAAVTVTACPLRPQSFPGLRERARLLEGGVLPHQGRVLHQGRFPPQLLLARSPAAAATAAAAAAVRAVNLEGVRGRRRQRQRRRRMKQPRGPVAPGPASRRRVGRGRRVGRQGARAAAGGARQPGTESLLEGGRRGGGCSGKGEGQRGGGGGTVAVGPAAAAELGGGPLVLQLIADVLPEEGRS